MKRGPISAIAAPSRLLALFILIPGIFAASLPALGVTFACCGFVLGLEGLGVRQILRELPGLLVLCILVVGMDCITIGQGMGFNLRTLPFSARHALALATSYALALLFYRATPSSELRHATARLGSCIPGRGGADLSLALFLVLGFIPVISREWTESWEAGRARGIARRFDAGSAIRVIEAFLRRIILAAWSLPEILAARGWTGESPRGRGIGSGPSVIAPIVAAVFSASALCGWI